MIYYQMSIVFGEIFKKLISHNNIDIKGGKNVTIPNKLLSRKYCNRYQF